MNNGIMLSPLEIDYLKANGELIGFDATNMKHRDIVVKYMNGVGLDEGKSGDDWVLFENKDTGVRAFFSNFPMNNKKSRKRPTLSIDFSGHFFIRKNADIAAREIIRFFVKSFGTFFKLSRVDIRQDIYNAKFPFDYFPDFTKKENDLVWALRGNPEFHLYHNSAPTDPATGFTIKTSRYTIMSYNRNLALEQKYRKGEITTEYYKHYTAIYRGRDVQRLEISLKQDACKIFALIFFNDEYDKDKLLRLSMANFARNHALKNFDPKKKLHKMHVEETFSQLFFYEEKEELKYFRAKLEAKVGLSSLTDVVFSEKGRPLEEIIKMLGKKICELADGSTNKLIDLKSQMLGTLKHYLNEFKNIVNDRRDRYQRVMEFMNMDALVMNETRHNLHQFLT